MLPNSTEYPEAVAALKSSLAFWDGCAGQYFGRLYDSSQAHNNADVHSRSAYKLLAKTMDMLEEHLGGLSVEPSISKAYLADLAKVSTEALCGLTTQ